MTGATGNIYNGLQEFEDMAFVLHLLRSSDLFVDVGANVGAYTILAAAVVGAACISFEPIPSTFQHLLNNIRLNNVSDLCECHNVALGHSDGTATCTTHLDTMNHIVESSNVEQNEVVTVPVRTLDAIVRDRAPKLIKIDVEGFETEVIAGGRSVLSCPSLTAVIMESNGSGGRYRYDEGKLHGTMLRYGFTPCSYFPFERKLISLTGKKVFTDNMLYVRDLTMAQSFVRVAPAVQVHGYQI